MHLKKKTKGKLTMNIKITFCVAICSKKKKYAKIIQPAQTQTKIDKIKMGRRRRSHQRKSTCEVNSLQERTRRIYTIQEVFNHIIRTSTS